ncbi:uncharacterized protein LOC119579097 [Penaeus monodon]|uniref:uncharacterized protein LOC119579097 n=1 Tax=Penaeus monodon TaxID=6687 RepID=UPI0018A751EF|nr:uncharacterized protein LOC119579097 [Penaeus monodon]
MSLFYSSLSETNGTNIENLHPKKSFIHRKYLLGLLKQLRSQNTGGRRHPESGPERGRPSSHQFQTRGSLNLLPPGLLGQPPPPTPPPTQFDLLFGQQQLERREGTAEGHLVASVAVPSLGPPRGEAKRLASGAEGSSLHHLTPASAMPSGAQPSRPTTRLPLPLAASDSQDGLPEILPVPQYINRSPSLQTEPLPHPSIAVNAFGHPFFDTSQLPLGTNSDLTASGEQEALLFPSSELLPMSPSELTHERVSHPDPEGFAKPEFYPNYETLAEALQLLQQLNALQASPTLNRVDLRASTYLEQDPSILPSPGNSNLDYLYDQDYLQYAALSNPVPNTRLTTEVNDAFSTLAQNLADAISTFLTDIGDAIAAQPALLLLGLIPFALLVFSLYHFYGDKKMGYGSGGGGYSSGGGGYSSGGHGRALSSIQLSVEALETLTWMILLQIEDFQKRHQFSAAG